MSLRTLSLFATILLVSGMESKKINEDFSPCCAFGGDGAAFTYGIGTITFPETSGTGSYSAQVPISIGASGDVAKPFVVVAVDPITSPQDSIMGWYITQNFTAQTLYAWTNFSNNPQCFSASVPLPEYYTPGFSLCTAGIKGTLFQNFNYTYNLGSFSGNLVSQISGPNRPQVSAYMSFSTDDACAPLSLSAANNPLNTGSFSVNILGGESIAPTWTIPSYC